MLASISIKRFSSRVFCAISVIIREGDVVSW
jgi:hypothetical protein